MIGTHILGRVRHGTREFLRRELVSAYVDIKFIREPDIDGEVQDVSLPSGSISQ